MTDGVFFLKSFAGKDIQALPWPAGTKLIGLDPVAMGLGCGGSDAYCSTAFSSMWSALGGKAGVMPVLRRKYGIDGRISFVSFSAGHGLMNPLLANDADRADVAAVVLLDSTFGSGKAGYVKAVQDAAAGKLMLTSITSDKGTTDPLQNGDYAFREYVLKPSGLTLSPTTVRPPVSPAPAEGTFRNGKLWYLRFTDAQVHHYDLGKIQAPILAAYLVPYLNGELGGLPWWLWAGIGAAAAGGGAYWWLKRKR